MSFPKRFNRCNMLPVAASLGAAALLSGTAMAQAATAPPSVEFRNCSEQTAVLSYPAGPYRDLLPPGFRFTGLAGAGLSVLVSAAGSTCESLLIDGNDVGGSADLLVFAQVDPPAQFRDPAIPFYAVAVTGYSTRDELVAAFAALGFGDTIGKGSVEVTAVDHPALRERRGRVVASNAVSRVTTQTVVFGPLVQRAPSRTRLFAVKNRKLIAIADGDYSGQSGYVGVGLLVQQGDGPSLLPATGVTAGHGIGYDLRLFPVPLP